MLPSRVVGRRRSLSGALAGMVVAVCPWMAALHQSQAGTGVCPAGVGSRGHPARVMHRGAGAQHGTASLHLWCRPWRVEGGGVCSIGEGDGDRRRGRRGRRATFPLDRRAMKAAGVFGVVWCQRDGGKLALEESEILGRNQRWEVV